MCQPGPQRQPDCWIGEATPMESDEASGMASEAVALATAIVAATSSLIVSLIGFFLLAEFIRREKASKPYLNRC
jgi:hypothetical protein